jgi:hypothetical protein
MKHEAVLIQVNVKKEIFEGKYDSRKEKCCILPNAPRRVRLG